MLKFDYLKNIICIISFHTYGWIESCLADFQRHCGQKPLLIIDNNPSCEDSHERWKTYECKESRAWKMECEQERAFTHSVNIAKKTVIQTPHYFDHGSALNFAVDWCKENKYQAITLIEPDCTISGCTWLNNLERAILNGYWMAGGTKAFHQAIHPFASIWKVDKIPTSFNCISKIPDIKADGQLFYKLCGTESPWFEWAKTNWDTALRAWYLLAKQDKTKWVETPDIVHHWEGSYRKRKITEQFDVFR